MRGNIIGEELEPYVANQIKNRQTISGAGSLNNPLNRNNKVLNFLNTRNAWVKLASGVGILDEARDKLKEIISSDNYQGTGKADKEGNKGFSNNDIDALFGKNLAQNFILFNTIQSLNKDGSYKPRSGVITNSSWNDSFDKMYGGMGYKGQGLKPVPGITNVTVQSINRGSLRKATVTIKAYNKFQFAIIELLYLRLGYIMLLEYGWDKYIDNIDTSTAPPSINIENVGSTVLENLWFKYEGGCDPANVRSSIEGNKDRYKGNYDGFLGKVHNFDWKLNSDLSYDITIQLITLGDVITSLKAKNPGFFTKGQLRELQEKLAIQRYTVGIGESKPTGYLKDQIKERATKTADKNLPNIGSDQVTIDITNIELNFEELYKRKDGNYLPFYELIPTVKESGEEEVKRYYKNETFEFDRNGYNETFKDNQFITGKIALSKVKGKFYIRFGEFLNQFFQTVNNYAKNSGGSNLIPELQFEEDIENIICNYERNFVPLDPTVCVFQPSIDSNFRKKLYPEGGIRDTSVTALNQFFINDSTMKRFVSLPKDPNYRKGVTYGKLMNLYLSTDFILKELNTNNNKLDNLSVFTFLQNLCNGINNAMAGLTNIEPVLKDDVIVTFVEQNLPKGYPKIPLESSKQIGKPVQFELVGYNPETGNSNFVKDFGFITKITPELSNIISIGAAASNSSTKTIKAIAFNEWNKGLSNRYKERYTDTNTSIPTLSYEEDVIKAFKANGNIDYQTDTRSFKVTWNYNGKKLIFYPTNIKPLGDKQGGRLTYKGREDKNSAYLKEFPTFKAQVLAEARLSEGLLEIAGGQVGTETGSEATDYLSYLAVAFGGRRTNLITDGVTAEKEYVPVSEAQYFNQNNDFIKLGKSLWRIYRAKLDQAQFEKENVVSNGTGFIPLHLQLTVDGISGVKIYNKLNIDQKFLPANYPDVLNFITMKTDHKIDNNTWESSYECFSIPASTNTPSGEDLSVNDIKPTKPDDGEIKDISPNDDRFKTIWRAEGYPKDISTTNSFSKTGLMFYEEETKKNQIVLHHTATNPSSNEMKGVFNYWGGKTGKAEIKFPLSTHYVIDREGNFVQTMPENYWSNNSGKGTETRLQKSQVSFELMSAGWVKGRIRTSTGILPENFIGSGAEGDVEFYQPNNNRKFNPEDIARPVKFVRREANGSLYPFYTEYRGYRYFEKYTDAQLLRLEDLLYQTAAYHKIPILSNLVRINDIKFEKSASTRRQTDVSGTITNIPIPGTTVILSSGFKDSGLPSYGLSSPRGNRLEIPTKVGQNAFIDWYKNMFPTINKFGVRGLNGEPGTYSHNTFQKSRKTDVFPQLELIFMLYRLSLREPESGGNLVYGAQTTFPQLLPKTNI